MIASVVMTAKGWFLIAAVLLTWIVIPCILLSMAYEQGCKNPYYGKDIEIHITIEKIADKDSNIESEATDKAHISGEDGVSTP